jgi:hypothetical protein
MRLDSQGGQRPSYFDISYGIPSVRLTAGNTVITTTGADYYGLLAIVSSAPVTFTVYNNTTASGAVIDVITVTASERVLSDTPIRARLGISVNITGTNGVGTVFYTPKG